MRALHAQIAKLKEDILAHNGLLIVAQCAPGAEDDALDLLSRRGIDPDAPENTLILLKAYSEGSTEILSVTGK